MWKAPKVWWKNKNYFMGGLMGLLLNISNTENQHDSSKFLFAFQVFKGLKCTIKLWEKNVYSCHDWWNIKCFKVHVLVADERLWKSVQKVLNGAHHRTLIAARWWNSGRLLKYTFVMQAAWRLFPKVAVKTHCVKASFNWGCQSPVYKCICRCTAPSHNSPVEHNGPGWSLLPWWRSDSISIASGEPRFSGAAAGWGAHACTHRCDDVVERAGQIGRWLCDRSSCGCSDDDPPAERVSTRRSAVNDGRKQPARPWCCRTSGRQERQDGHRAEANNLHQGEAAHNTTFRQWVRVLCGNPWPDVRVHAFTLPSLL